MYDANIRLAREGMNADVIIEQRRPVLGHVRAFGANTDPHGAKFFHLDHFGFAGPIGRTLAIDHGQASSLGDQPVAEPNFVEQSETTLVDNKLNGPCVNGHALPFVADTQ